MRKKITIISKKTLNMIEASVKNLKKGKASKVIDLKQFKEK